MINATAKVIHRIRVSCMKLICAPRTQIVYWYILRIDCGGYFVRRQRNNALPFVCMGWTNPSTCYTFPLCLGCGSILSILWTESCFFRHQGSNSERELVWKSFIICIFRVRLIPVICPFRIYCETFVPGLKSTYELWSHSLHITEIVVKCVSQSIVSTQKW